MGSQEEAAPLPEGERAGARPPPQHEELVEVELNDAHKKKAEYESLLALNAELNKELQGLSSKVKEYSDQTKQLELDLSQQKAKAKEEKLAIHEKYKSEEGNLRRQIEDLEGKQRANRDEMLQLKSERRSLRSEILDLKGNIRVFCRVRPPLDKERHSPMCKFITSDGGLKMESSSPLGAASQSSSKLFYLSEVFLPVATQEEVYGEISPLVESALDGYNVCIFAYGQTGSGKTFTMEGEPDPQSRGMIPRAVETIFKSLDHQRELGWEYTIRVSFLEIYNEKIRDLLNPKTNLKHEVREDEGMTVSNLTVKTVTHENQVNDLLAVAKKNRTVAATDDNAASSRSHSIMEMRFEGANSSRHASIKGTLTLVDLAGSEEFKVENTGEKKAETKNINMSLHCLRSVIHGLKNKEPVTFRDSKLTRLLESSLKENSRTLLIVNLKPRQSDYKENLRSLDFAQSAADVKVGANKQMKTTFSNIPVSNPRIAQIKANNGTSSSSIPRLQRPPKK